MRKRLFYKETCKLRDLETAIHLLRERLDDHRFKGFEKVIERNLNYSIQEKEDLLCDMKKMGWDGY
jgi:hypothetical protein